MSSDRFHDLVSRAGSAPRLVSLVERLDDIDPLDAIETIGRLSRHDQDVARLIGTRMFWSRPVEGFSIAGIGAAVTLAPEGADRFATIDRDWKSLVGDALIDDDSSDSAGGPVLMGGFAFDPEGPHSDAWRDFPAASLFVPALQIVRDVNGCWLTTSHLAGDSPTNASELGVIARARAMLTTTRGARRDHTSVAGARLGIDEMRRGSEWRDTVREAVAAIRAGRIAKVVLAREVRASATGDFDVIAALRQLRAAHETSYVFACWRGDSAFLGATPERLVRVDGSHVRASSLAGSVRRGQTPEDDDAQAASLLNSGKDREEHEFVRRALCTGLARLCDDVTAGEAPELLSLPNVHHLHTAVHARLRPGHTLLQLVAQLHPTPAVGGEPRNAALRFIREHERMDRGWYAAPVGWMQRDRGEFAVALRSALVRGGEALLFAGCGVVADSDPAQEYAESLLKLRPMENALSVTAASDAERPEHERAPRYRIAG